MICVAAVRQSRGLGVATALLQARPHKEPGGGGEEQEPG